MKKTLLIPALMAFALMQAGAQTLKVKSIEQVAISGTHDARFVYHPTFTPDGNSLLLTSEGYDGLAVLNLSNRSVKQLSDLRGAGYMPAVSADASTVVIREIDTNDLTMSLYAVDMQSAISTPLQAKMAHTNAIVLKDGAMTLADNGKLKAKGVGSRKIRAAANAQPVSIFLTEEDLKPVLYIGGMRRVIDPLSTPDHDVNYCWSSLSPDQKKIVFTAGKYTYTCALDGSNLKNIGEIHAPVWLDNEVVVGMNDSDDGHRTLASDILAVKADGTGRQQLTPSSQAIKMFPSVSPDRNRIAFHTTDGKIFIINVER